MNCVFPGCPIDALHNRMWCKRHQAAMTELAAQGRRAREADGCRTAWWWTQISRAGGDEALSAACTDILANREIPADGIIRLFTVLAPWRDEPALKEAA